MRGGAAKMKRKVKSGGSRRVSMLRKRMRQKRAVGGGAYPTMPAETIEKDTGCVRLLGERNGHMGGAPKAARRGQQKRCKIPGEAARCAGC